MARVFTVSGLLGSVSPTAEDPLFHTTGTITPHSGGGIDVAFNNTSFRSAQCDFGSAQSLSTDYYTRSRVKLSGLPTTSTPMLIQAQQATGGVRIAAIGVTTAGIFVVFDTNGTNVATTNVAATPGTTQCLELHWNAGNGTAGTGTIEAWIDGVQIASVVGTAQTGTAAHRFVQFGKISSVNYGITTVTYTDCAVNDSTGSAQNGRCGLGTCVLLKPVADVSTTGFTNGAGVASGLAQALNTIPPGGVALASATTTSQIKDATSNTTDNTQIALATPASVGVGADDTIVLAKACASHGSSSTVASRTDGIQAVSNPTIAEVTGLTPNAATAATWPAGWNTLWTGYSYTPTIDVTENPVVEFRKGTASTDSSMACLLGLLVEHISTASGTTVIKKAHGGEWV